jgi:imidazolonepropionase
MAILIKNIKELLQVHDSPPEMVKGEEMGRVPSIHDAWLFIENDKISDYGSMENLDTSTYINKYKNLKTVDATGKYVFPSFMDSHTHLVYPGSREGEFVDRIKGLSYEEIAKRGGGILNSARKLAAATEDELYEAAYKRLEHIMAMGTCGVEIKSGYGLSVEGEMKMLRVIKRLKENSPLLIKSTFLGAHAIPLEFRENRSKYLDIVIHEMIPEAASLELADFIDVFCDRGFFTVAETERILMAGHKYGLRPKIHANELDFSGGIQTGVKYDALSVDHLEFTGDDEIKVLKDSETMPTLLPGAAFFLGMKDPPARKMIEAGLPLALASDYNPGSSPSGNMQFIMSLGCIKLKLLPGEALNAVTINGAYAMDAGDTHGTITRGKNASVLITGQIPSLAYIPYSFGSNNIETVILNGEIL